MNVVIEISSDDGLSEDRWTFYYYDTNHTLFLDTYAKFERPTLRHKFKMPRDRYNRLDSRGSLKLDEVPYPPEVEGLARDQFVGKLRIKKEWSR